MNQSQREYGTGRWHSAVRAADCDWFGHANNAVYADYLMSATLAAWGGELSAADWRLRRIDMDFRNPVVCGDEIEVSSWQAGGERRAVRCAHRITNSRTQEVVAEATTEWETGPNSPGDRWTAEAEASSIKLRSSPDNLNRPDAFVYRRVIVAQPYEADSSGEINPTWIFRWGWASMMAATAEAGWAPGRWQEAGFITYQNQRRAELFSALHPGDEVEIQSRLCDLHRIRGTWEHRIVCGGEPAAVDWASGVFLNLEGRIAPPPEGLMESILAGRDVS